MPAALLKQAVLRKHPMQDDDKSGPGEKFVPLTAWAVSRTSASSKDGSAKDGSGAGGGGAWPALRLVDGPAVPRVPGVGLYYNELLTGGSAGFALLRCAARCCAVLLGHE